MCILKKEFPLHTAHSGLLEHLEKDQRFCTLKSSECRGILSSDTRRCCHGYSSVQSRALASSKLFSVSQSSRKLIRRTNVLGRTELRPWKTGFNEIIVCERAPTHIVNNHNNSKTNSVWLLRPWMASPSRLKLPPRIFVRQGWRIGLKIFPSDATNFRQLTEKRTLARALVQSDLATSWLKPRLPGKGTKFTLAIMMIIILSYDAAG